MTVLFSTFYLVSSFLRHINGFLPVRVFINYTLPIRVLIILKSLLLFTNFLPYVPVPLFSVQTFLFHPVLWIRVLADPGPFAG
jgi:hypothetical protein